MINLLTSGSSVFQKIGDALTSKIALIVYAAIVLVLLIFLVIRIALNEQNRVSELKRWQEARHANEKREAVDDVRKDLNQKMDAIDRKVSSVISGLEEGIALTGVAPVAETEAAEEEREEADEGEENGEEEKGEEGGSRFYMLTEIDRSYENYERPEYNDKITLRELCEEFRNYSAGELKLYYDIEDIRRFIGALAVTKLIILQGMSGTGKTSLAYAFGEFLQNKTEIGRAHV